MGRFKLEPTDPPAERVLLVGVELPGAAWDIHETMAELERLVVTAGSAVVAATTQKLEHPNPRTFVGSGKVQEIKDLIGEYAVDVVIFDDELTPSQQSNLERSFAQLKRSINQPCQNLARPVKVIDRTALILDIFGKHAKTKAGRLQVQLAQLSYLLPRLRGMWSHLVREQTRGGIGSRFGQGETQLEVDRRLVRKRIAVLKTQLEKLGRQREVQSKARLTSGVFRVALVGYTNAGKSTLLNALTQAEVYVEDELFATLDPTTRTHTLLDGRTITVTDTVGFIQKLPTLVVESFRSTLAEAMEADLLLLVVDASSPYAEKEISVVRHVLRDIHADKTPCLLVCNKCDCLDEQQQAVLRARHPDALLISAEKKTGLAGLELAITREAGSNEELFTVCIPYTASALLERLHRGVPIINESFETKGSILTIKANARLRAELAPYKIQEHK